MIEFQQRFFVQMSVKLWFNLETKFNPCSVQKSGVELNETNDILARNMNIFLS